MGCDDFAISLTEVNEDICDDIQCHFIELALHFFGFIRFKLIHNKLQVEIRLKEPRKIT